MNNRKIRIIIIFFSCSIFSNHLLIYKKEEINKKTNINIDSSKTSATYTPTHENNLVSTAPIQTVNTLNSDYILALQWINYIQDTDQRTQQIKKILSRWTSESPNDLLSWANQDNNLNDYGVAIYASLIDVDLKLAVSALYMVQNMNRADINKIINMIDVAITDTNSVDQYIAQEFISHIFSLPSGEYKRETVRILAPKLLDYLDYDEAMITLEQLADTEQQKELQLALTYQWSKLDPWISFQFAQTLAEGPTQTDIISQTLDQLATYDLESANQWLASIPKPSDDMIRPVIQKAITSNQHAIAMHWINKLSDTQLKTEAITRTFQSLFMIDTSSAIDFLQKQSVFTPSEKNLLIQYLNQKPKTTQTFTESTY